MKHLTPFPTLAKPKCLARRFEQAFTRIEVCTLLFALGLLVSLALPALANKARSQQITCFNNLRQIGRAFHLWANDHDNLFPMYVPVAQGGTRPPILTTTTAWFQFGALSNELVTPKVLACPADTKRTASEFSMNPDGGLFHQNFRNSAVSYFLTDAYLRYPEDIFSGDRNLRIDPVTTGCSVYGNGVGLLNMQSGSTIWTNNMHLNMGHLLHIDGQVEQLDNIGLRNRLPVIRRDDASIHLLLP